MTSSTSTTTKTAAASSALPRFQLRKRSTANMPSAASGFKAVNSAFLSGLFADVALFAKTTDQQDTKKRSHRDDPRLDSCKKSRINNMSHSISRCNMSVKNLQNLATAVSVSPTASTTNYFDDQPSMSRQDSLLLQLSCVGSSTSAASLAFPHLPATVSQSSCDGTNPLTRIRSDLQSSVAENDHPNNETPETYGWFVEMDGPDDDIAAPRATTSTTIKDPLLAFSAATAPCADDHADDVEWAKAADTVDDVLGDFF